MGWFLARNSIYPIALYMQSPIPQSVRLSVCPSVTRVDQSKMVEVKIMQVLAQSNPMTLVSSLLTSLDIPKATY